MNNKRLQLFKEFSTIRKMKWIKSKRKGPTGIGYTFESLLGKEENSLPIADYEGIEIKTIRLFSKRNIHLFNATPDGDYLYPLKRIIDTIGYPDKINNKCTVFVQQFSGDKYSLIGYYKKGKLVINKKEEKIDLLIKNNQEKNIDIYISWSFELIEKKIYDKIKNLAIITALTKEENNQEFFFYNRIEFYEIISFEKFLELIEKGVIKVTFKIYSYREGPKEGQINDHGTDFSIKMDDIELLYKRVSIGK